MPAGRAPGRPSRRLRSPDSQPGRQPQRAPASCTVETLSSGAGHSAGISIQRKEKHRHLMLFSQTFINTSRKPGSPCWTSVTFANNSSTSLSTAEPMASPASPAPSETSSAQDRAGRAAWTVLPQSRLTPAPESPPCSRRCGPHQGLVRSVDPKGKASVSATPATAIPSPTSVPSTED